MAKQPTPKKKTAAKKAAAKKPRAKKTAAKKAAPAAPNMVRLEAIFAELPEYHRVDVEAWDNEPTYRVRNKNFVFTNADGTHLGLKLDKDEARAVVASDDAAGPMGYGLGRHGWIGVVLDPKPTEERWAEVREWVRTSYTLVAPKSLARLVLEEDGLANRSNRTGH